jgi:hypothetical protein
MENEEYKIGDIVFLLTDPNQFERIITGILIRPDGIRYYLSHSTEETIHFNIEISKEINQIIKLL